MAIKSRYEPTSPTTGIFFANDDTNIILPNGPSATGGQPIADGYEISVVDNFQSADMDPITIVGEFSEEGVPVVIDTAGGMYVFRWMGAFYALV